MTDNEMQIFIANLPMLGKELEMLKEENKLLMKAKEALLKQVEELTNQVISFEKTMKQIHRMIHEGLERQCRET